MDDQLAQLLERISQQTGMPVEQLIGIALWDFVRSFDWNYQELKEGAIYHPALAMPIALPVG